MGQEQVTTPLSAALDAGRINHAYLFSGPRGCGKTSSARIMARSLNCEHGPTSTPCGKCDSCVSLAPGGPGNLDVTELDAASHNGVEDMRELRDRAYYAPAESRYRIFIIDEAHMISPSGANALLKVVEEPPEHVIFIFATTEPEKIIGTIRSRTHHYPFRLLTPPAMKGLLQRTVAAEGVHVEDAVYPMVIEAGGGSPRDTLSLLDQLLAGAGPDGLTYDLARPLLGVTDVSLLDDAIDTLANQDKPGLFAMVDHVIEAGHDPRRFAIDLLDRLRDLMILQAVPGAIEAGLVSAPTDRASVLTAQAQRFSGPQLTYLASTVNDRISDLTGATSPRLLLEIMCAHLLIGSTGPAATGATVPAAAPGAPVPAGPATPGGAAAATSAVAGAQDPQSAAAAIIARRRAKSQEQHSAGSEPAPQPQTQTQPPAKTAQSSTEQQTPQQQQQPQVEPQPQSEPEPEPQESQDPWQRERRIPQSAPAQQERQEQRIVGQGQAEVCAPLLGQGTREDGEVGTAGLAAGGQKIEPELDSRRIARQGRAQDPCPWPGVCGGGVAQGRVAGGLDLVGREPGKQPPGFHLRPFTPVRHQGQELERRLRLRHREQAVEADQEELERA